MGSSPAERTILWLFSTSLSLIINTKNSIYHTVILIIPFKLERWFNSRSNWCKKFSAMKLAATPTSGFSNQVLVSQTVLDTLQLIFRAQINCLAVSFSNSCSQQMHGMSQISYPIFPFYFSPIAQISSWNLGITKRLYFKKYFLWIILI